MTPDLCAHAHHMRLCFRVFYIIKASHMVVLQRAGKELGPSPRRVPLNLKKGAAASRLWRLDTLETGLCRSRAVGFISSGRGRGRVGWACVYGSVQKLFQSGRFGFPRVGDSMQIRVD